HTWIAIRHDWAGGAGIGIEQPFGAERARACDPKPIDDGKIDRAAVERKLACIGRSRFADLQIEPGILGKAVTADHVQLPGERSGALRTDAQGLGCRRGSGADNEPEQRKNLEPGYHSHFLTSPFMGETTCTVDPSRR